MRTVPMGQIGSSVGRCSEFDGGDGDRRSTLVWEMKRQAGRLLKLLRALRNAGY
jgi:hypothetical protein